MIFKLRELIPCCSAPVFSSEILKLTLVWSIDRPRVMFGASQVRHIAPDAHVVVVVSVDIALR